jgi:hypothetical protein
MRLKTHPAIDLFQSRRDDLIVDIVPFTHIKLHRSDLLMQKAPDFAVRGSHEKNGKIAFGQ